MCLKLMLLLNKASGIAEQKTNPIPSPQIKLSEEISPTVLFFCTVQGWFAGAPPGIVTVQPISRGILLDASADRKQDFQKNPLIGVYQEMIAEPLAVLSSASSWGTAASMDSFRFSADRSHKRRLDKSWSLFQQNLSWKVFNQRDRVSCQSDSQSASPKYCYSPCPQLGFVHWVTSAHYEQTLGHSTGIY